MSADWIFPECVCVCGGVETHSRYKEVVVVGVWVGMGGGSIMGSVCEGGTRAQE